MTCPSCGQHNIKTFYKVENAPIHSVLVLKSYDQAVNFPKRDIELGFCRDCGFIFNTVFDSSVLAYSEECEETQGYSNTFNAFHRKLAADLVERHDLHEKNIIEIGCGKGEFLNLLCDLGNNHGVGFDPAYVPGRLENMNSNVSFIQDYYSEKYSDYKADFICCKMTLEHIPNVFEFISLVRRSIGDQLDTTVMFQVPDARRVLQDLAFWDIYYEHCSYFSAGSLAKLFANAGFEVLRLVNVYDNQYLIIEAKPARESASANQNVTYENVDDLAKDVAHFEKSSPLVIHEWLKKIQDLHNKGEKIIIWGGGSKGVAFLVTLKLLNEIGRVVDINPHKDGTFMAGSGHLVVTPDKLLDYKPDAVVIMNPVYEEEIRSELLSLGLHPTLLPLAGQ